MEECTPEEQCQKLTECEVFSSALERVLIDICNEVMGIDGETGRFLDHRLAEDVNNLLGI